MAIKFGTEGWRAIMAEQFTADNVRIVTQAIAEHLRQQTHVAAKAPGAIAVGHDTRFLSPYFAQAVAEVLAGNGLPSVLTDRALPTCAVSRYVVAKRLPAGIMITASHNPPEYNGLKVKETFGGSATSETVASIEQRIGASPVKRLPLDEAEAQGLVRRGDFLSTYLAGIRAFIDLKAIHRAKLRVVVDSMHGAGGRIIETLAHGGACRVDTMHSEPDPAFGGHAPEPIATHLSQLIAAMKRPGIDLGIANDGDADRLGVIGPKGRWLNPGQIMCILLMHLITHRKAKGAVVKTVSNTMMINRVTESLGLRLIEVPVGFKLIAKLMQEEDILIGGEESGGIGLKGYLPERDGLVNGLLLMEALAVRRQKLPAVMDALERRFGRWHYGRQDLHLKMPQVERLFKRLKEATPEALDGMPVASVNTLDGVKLIGRDESWLLFRRSGTEPIVRIYAETPQAARLPKLLDFGVKLTVTN
ncbi:MAG: phosphoglucomutase/phosphomannomutase family protein [Candidatus Omnitrophica bacterium]|nr:phosphoglucomutase/phosphomannomutase family protein [Candidatus Omnitrophota bacterium]